MPCSVWRNNFCAKTVGRRGRARTSRNLFSREAVKAQAEKLLPEISIFIGLLSQARGYYRGGKPLAEAARAGDATPRRRSFTVLGSFHCRFSAANPDSPARDVAGSPPVINPTVRQLDYNFARSLPPFLSRSHARACKWIGTIFSRISIKIARPTCNRVARLGRCISKQLINARRRSRDKREIFIRSLLADQNYAAMRSTIPFSYLLSKRYQGIRCRNCSVRWSSLMRSSNGKLVHLPTRLNTRSGAERLSTRSFGDYTHFKNVSAEIRTALSESNRGKR